jgi:hypothetical protein
MMIARTWIHRSVPVEGRQTIPQRFSHQSRKNFAGAIRHLLPSRRDREVPYGMKGGELNGHEEEGSC